MWQTLLGLMPVTALALGLGGWTCWDIARSIRAPREDVRGGRRD